MGRPHRRRQCRRRVRGGERRPDRAAWSWSADTHEQHAPACGPARAPWRRRREEENKRGPRSSPLCVSLFWAGEQRAARVRVLWGAAGLRCSFEERRRRGSHLAPYFARLTCRAPAPAPIAPQHTRARPTPPNPHTHGSQPHRAGGSGRALWARFVLLCSSKAQAAAAAHTRARWCARGAPPSRSPNARAAPSPHRRRPRRRPAGPPAAAAAAAADRLAPPPAVC